MKNIWYSAISFMICTMVVPIDASSCNPCKKQKLPVTISCPAVDCGSNIVLISTIGPSGYIIGSPGRYCLTNNISWAPSAGGTSTSPVAAITITSFNVQLDLNGYTLTGPNNLSNTVGIKVGNFSSQLYNVSIINGSVQGFTLGIYVDPVQNLYLSNISAIRNGLTGSISNGGFNFVGGVALVGANQNVFLNNVNTSFNGGVGGAIATFGTFINGSTDVVIQNSNFDQNTSVADVCHGLRCNVGSNFSIQNSQASNNTGAVQVAGFAFTGTVDANFTTPIEIVDIRNSIAKNNQLAGIPGASQANYNTLVGAGFLFANADSSVIVDCTAFDNFQIGTLQSAPLPVRTSGFEMYWAFDSTFTNCIATDNDNFLIDPAGSGSFGFHLSGNRIICENCQANGHKSQIPLSAGFGLEKYRDELLAFPTNTAGQSMNTACVFNRCATERNLNGIHIKDTTESIIEYCNCQGNVNDGILVDQASTALCTTSRNIIKYNQLIGNYVWGIEDNSGPFTGAFTGPSNAYIYNQALDNRPLGSPGVPGTTNYNTGVHLAGPPNDLYITLWTIPGGSISPTGAFSKISNLDMTSISCTGPNVQ